MKEQLHEPIFETYLNAARMSGAIGRYAKALDDGSKFSTVPVRAKLLYQTLRGALSRLGLTDKADAELKTATILALSGLITEVAGDMLGDKKPSDDRTMKLIEYDTYAVQKPLFDIGDRVTYPSECDCRICKEVSAEWQTVCARHVVISDPTGEPVADWHYTLEGYGFTIPESHLGRESH